MILETELEGRRARFATTPPSQPAPRSESLRHEFAAHLGSETGEDEEDEATSAAHTDLHRRAVAAARRAVLGMRANDDIGDDAFHQLEEELDWIEMASGAREP